MRPIALLLAAPLMTGCGDDGGSTTPATESPSLLEQYVPANADGPFPIGVLLTTFVDDTRPELATTDTTDNRTLPTVVWYPAAEAARDEPKAVLGDALLPAVRSTLGALTAAGYLDTPSNGVLDAEIANGGPFPLIVFSHGNTGIGAQSYFLTEYLASHGYIVVCPDHTGNAIMTELPGGTAIGYGGEGGAYSLAMAAVDRPADVSFLVDAMSELNAHDPDARFTNKVDLEHVGLTGHSFGGLTTLLAMAQDDRFDAGAPMAPAVPASSAIDRPVMDFVASEDHTVPIPDIATNYSTLSGPKAYITVIDAGHFSFSNGCPFGIGTGDGCGEGTRLADGSAFTFIADSRAHEITKYYQTAFWGYYLKGVKEYSKDLLAEPFGSDMTIERDGMP